MILIPNIFCKDFSHCTKIWMQIGTRIFISKIQTNTFLDEKASMNCPKGIIFIFQWTDIYLWAFSCWGCRNVSNFTIRCRFIGRIRHFSWLGFQFSRSFESFLFFSCCIWSFWALTTKPDPWGIKFPYCGTQSSHRFLFPFDSANPTPWVERN